MTAAPAPVAWIAPAPGRNTPAAPSPSGRATNTTPSKTRGTARARAFATAYATRAGIEGTLSRGVRTCRLRRTRYVGQAKTHLGHVLTAAGMNFLRLGEWFADRPRARTRRSPFTTLMAEVTAA